MVLDRENLAVRLKDIPVADTGDYALSARLWGIATFFIVVPAIILLYCAIILLQKEECGVNQLCAMYCLYVMWAVALIAFPAALFTTIMAVKRTIQGLRNGILGTETEF